MEEMIDYYNGRYTEHTNYNYITFELTVQPSI